MCFNPLTVTEKYYLVNTLVPFMMHILLFLAMELFQQLEWEGYCVALDVCSGCYCVLRYSNSAKYCTFSGSLVGTSDSSSMPWIPGIYCGREQRGTEWHAPRSALSSSLCNWSECFHCSVCALNFTRTLKWSSDFHTSMILDVEYSFPGTCTD